MNPRGYRMTGRTNDPYTLFVTGPDHIRIKLPLWGEKVRNC